MARLGRQNDNPAPACRDYPAHQWRYILHDGQSLQGVALENRYMVTEMNIPLMEDPERNKLILDPIPAGCWGLPEDLMDALIFLSSKASDYVHGVLQPADGGFLTR